jgi:hypothetical protein
MTIQGQIDHPAVWKGSDFASPDDFAFDLGSDHIAAFDAAVESIKQRGLKAQHFGRSDFDLSPIIDDVKSIFNDLVEGRGMVLVRGFPVERYSAEDIGILYWGLGTHFGRAVSQSRMGDRMGEVTDVSGDDPRERGYRSNKELNLHTDSDEIVGLLCLQGAKSGGYSRLVSTLAMHNEINARHPEHLATLYEGFHHHWRGEEPEGEPPITPYRVPIFSECEGVISSCYGRYFIDMAAAESGEPLPTAAKAALDYFEEVAYRDDMLLSLRLQVGEAIFFNNYATLHARTEFEDYDEPERRRLLLRLWLDVPNGRPISEPLRRYYGTDGIKGRGDANTIYQGETTVDQRQ